MGTLPVDHLRNHPAHCTVVVPTLYEGHHSQSGEVGRHSPGQPGLHTPLVAEVVVHRTAAAGLHILPVVEAVGYRSDQQGELQACMHCHLVVVPRSLREADAA